MTAWKLRRSSKSSKNREGGLAAALYCFGFWQFSGLDRLYVLGLPALGALDYVKLHLLTLLETAESPSLNRREVYKDILAVLAADKTVALGVVKPLYCSCFHGVASFLLFDVALSCSQNFAGRIMLLSGDTGNCKNRKVKRRLILP
jgi:hypothetical protein